MKKHDIYFGGGCFWGVEKYFSCIEGVLETEVGYANGNKENPTYQEVCTSSTDFVECVHVLFDEDVVSLSFLLDMFYKVVDPTSLNRQGNDIGTQYRSGIYYIDKSDSKTIKESLLILKQRIKKEVVIECLPLNNFYLAEQYHQKYLDHNPNGYCHISKSMFEEAKKAKVRFNKKNDEELKTLLTQQQYSVTKLNATERPYENNYWNTFEEGIYVDITTGEPLFVSDDKFDSGCGWPSFSKPIDKRIINELRDSSHGMERTEVRSKTGDIHLGHVFTDGPTDKGGLRYCINSASLSFIPKDKMKEAGYEDYLYLLNK
ncbi:MAG: peptide-methionine (R)-S-oxide reductase MsrB [Coprobacillus sp.]